MPACIAVAILVLNASFSRTVSLMVTPGWAAMYSSARVLISVLPGSLTWRFHHSISTGAAGVALAAASLGATLAGASDAGADGAALVVPPPEHAPRMMAAVAIKPRIRFGDAMRLPPPGVRAGYLAVTRWVIHGDATTSSERYPCSRPVERGRPRPADRGGAGGTRRRGVDAALEARPLWLSNLPCSKVSQLSATVAVATIGQPTRHRQPSEGRTAVGDGSLRSKLSKCY